MDKSNPHNHVGQQEPMEMPVSEILTGNYHFVIPSYQRGYRWESKINKQDNEVRQVDDLLDDLTHFVTKNANNKANYYLQPLMVKPRYDKNNLLVWDVLDGQQRLTTMLLILKCLNEKLCQNQYFLYTIEYANRPNIDFRKISYDQNSLNYDYPKPNKNLDSFFVRKAKDRIKEWYDENVNTQQKKDKLKEALFYEDSSREPLSTPNLRVLFIWYNAEPIIASQSVTPSTSIEHDIKVFNRLNGGQISLTNSELLKALFLLCLKVDNGHIVDAETLVRKWDEMERKFQDNEFWNAISLKNKSYENRLDYLFDFIRESDNNAQTNNSYRYYYNALKQLLTNPNSKLLEEKWDEAKRAFDTLCKWHENTTLHNYIGFLIDCGMTPSAIQKEIIGGKPNKSAITTVFELIKKKTGVKEDEISLLRYHGDVSKICKILLLFNVETSEIHNERFSFDQYRGRKYDIEHINSQTDNAIRNADERIEWIEDQAIYSLNEDISSMDSKHTDISSIQRLIDVGNALLSQGDKMKQDDFDKYRQAVEQYYAPLSPNIDKDWIGNLTLLNSTINREYKNALFPQKLRTIKRSDQEGEYIPPCTRYLFMKYYSNTKANLSSFNMQRWNEDDQQDYANSIINTLKKFLS
jgi:uncharacterized protein with ParB-like and HNH nuclease domain